MKTDKSVLIFELATIDNIFELTRVFLSLFSDLRDHEKTIFSFIHVSRRRWDYWLVHKSVRLALSHVTIWEEFPINLHLNYSKTWKGDRLLSAFLHQIIDKKVKNALKLWFAEKRIFSHISWIRKQSRCIFVCFVVTQRIDVFPAFNFPSFEIILTNHFLM